MLSFLLYQQFLLPIRQKCRGVVLFLYNMPLLFVYLQQY